MNNTATNTATCPTVRKQIGKTTYPYRLHDTRPHFPAQYTAAGAAPLTTEYRRAAELTQRGDSRLYQRAVFLCGGDHTLTAFCPLAGQPQTRQKGYIYGIFQ